MDDRMGSCRWNFDRRARRLLLASALVLAPLAEARGQVKLCFPTAGQAPTLDAGHDLANDPGFSNAAKYVFNSGGPPSGELWATSDGTFLWLGAIGHGDTCPPNANDVFVVLFDLPGAPFEYRRFIVTPNLLGGATANPPQSAPIASAAQEFVANQPLVGGRVAWQNAQTNITSQSDIFVSADPAGCGTNGSWYVQMRFRLTDLGLATNVNFHMYFDLMRADDNNTTITPLVWPFSPDAWSAACDPATTPCAIGVPNPNASATTLSGPGTDANYPAPGTWGPAIIGTQGCGIYVTGGYNTNASPDMYVTCSPSGATNSDCTATLQSWPNLLISLTDPSTFHARVHNSTTQSTTVTANYSWAAFGVSAYANFQALPSNAGANLSWPINAGGPNDSANFTVRNTASIQPSAWPAPILQPKMHICTRLDLSGGSIPYLSAAAQQNMDFAPLSAYDDAVTIDGKGFGPPGANRTAHHFTLQPRAKATLAVSDGRVNGIPPNHVVEQVVWAVDASRNTGRYVVTGANKKAYEIVEPVTFGYVLQHDTGKPCLRRGVEVAGAVAGVPPCTAVPDPKVFGVPPASVDHFALGLAGADLKPGKNGAYEIDVAPNEVKRLKATAEYPKPCPCGCHMPGTTTCLALLGLVHLRVSTRRRRD